MIARTPPNEQGPYRRLDPTLRADALRRAVPSATLPTPSPCIGYQAIHLEVIQTRLDPRACARPHLLGHVRSGIPHVHAVSHGTVMLFLSGLLGWLPVRRDHDRRVVGGQQLKSRQSSGAGGRRSWNRLRGCCVRSGAKEHEGEKERSHGMVIQNPRIRKNRQARSTQSATQQAVGSRLSIYLSLLRLT